jgi:predicted anti-sigma-YlaC factor YlaD
VDKPESAIRAGGASRAAAARLMALAAVTALVSGACSIQKFALKKTADMLSAPSGSNTFTSDNDPELVGAALPFAVKFYESLLASIPSHDGLRVQTGSLYIMYANAFLQTPADMMPRSEREQREVLLHRAKNLYLRGRDMLLIGLERKEPKLLALLKERRYDQALAAFTTKDVPLMYWAAAGWVAAYAIDPFDMRLGVTLPQAAALMDRAMRLDPGFSGGAFHNFYILYYGSLPEYMGGDTAKARDHFRDAVEAAGQGDTTPYLSLAVTVSIREQKVREFRDLLKKVLDYDPDSHPETRLINILNQRKARFYLDHEEDYFLPEEKGPERNAASGRET